MNANSALAMVSSPINSPIDRTATGKAIWVVVVVLLIMLPTILFFFVRFWLPGDGNIVVFDFNDVNAEGLFVEPLLLRPNGVLPGDKVLALEGRSLESWLDDALSSVDGEVSLLMESQRETLWRDNQVVDMDVVLTPFPLGSALSRKWSIYLFAVYLLTISLFVFARRQHQIGARLFLLLGALVFGNITVFSLGLQVSEIRQPWIVRLWLWHLIVAGQLVLALLLHMSLVFPRRHPMLVRYPQLLLWCYLGVWLLYGGFLLFNWSSAESMTARLLLIVQGTVVTPVVYFPLVIVSWATSYATCKNPTERRQIAWILWGMVVGLGAFMALALVPVLLGPRVPLGTNFALVGIFLCAIPTTAMIAILREKLFDINLIVNRTLVYVPLTSILAGVYAASMAILPKLFTGNSAAASQTTVVLTTLLLTSTFTPIKNWLQLLVDRGFKEAPDPLKRLHEFDREILGIAQIIDVNQISRRFLEEAIVTLQARGGAINMVRNQQWTTIHCSEGWAGDATIEVPIVCNNVQLGALALGADCFGRAYSADECAMLQHTAAHVAIVVAILQSAGAIPSDQFYLSGHQEIVMAEKSRFNVE